MYGGQCIKLDTLELCAPLSYGLFYNDCVQFDVLPTIHVQC